MGLGCTSVSSSNSGQREQELVPDTMIVYASQDTLFFQSLVETVQQYHLENQPPEELLVTIGKHFLKMPYHGHTLEAPGIEKLQVNFRGVDCTTFMENVVVLTRILKQKNVSFGAYTNELMKIRYRKGQLEAYPSRLHYLSDWFYENEQKGVLKNITREIGGIPFSKKIHFMSSHWDKYPALADTTYRKEIGLIEQEINSRKMFYVPKHEVGKLEKKIQSGDIIGITTGIEGLDLIHVGLAVFVGDRLHLMHASSDAKEVVISEKPLVDYLAGNRLQTGIMVARLQLQN